MGTRVGSAVLLGLLALGIPGPSGPLAEPRPPGAELGSDAELGSEDGDPARAPSRAEVERAEALAMPGDPERGRAIYEVCAACHLAGGEGRSDGTFPVLASQHARVTVKQLADIRQGERENPIMHSFAATLVDPQEIADVAAYIETLPQPAANGRGPGTDLARGEELYRRDCVACHGEHGEGDGAALRPALAGQHYRYLLRQVRDVAAHRRENAECSMSRVVDTYSDAELAAVVDYASRLRRPAPEAADDDAPDDAAQPGSSDG